MQAEPLDARQESALDDQPVVGTAALERSRRIGRLVRDGEQRVRQLEAPLDALGLLTADDAYGIQAEYVALRVADGARPVGFKVGAGSRPSYGILFEDRVVASGSAIDRAMLIGPAVEVEIAFVLREPLRGASVTSADVLAATECLLLAFEVVDSRIPGWGTELVEIVADNGHAAMVVLGTQRVAPAGIDLRLVRALLERNGQLIGTGTGAVVLGDPTRSVAWLAGELGAKGREIGAGCVVLSGAIIAPVGAHQGDEFRASMEAIGEVSCRFT